MEYSLTTEQQKNDGGQTKLQLTNGARTTKRPKTPGERLMTTDVNGNGKMHCCEKTMRGNVKQLQIVLGRFVNLNRVQMVALETNSSLIYLGTKSKAKPGMNLI